MIFKRGYSPNIQYYTSPRPRITRAVQRILALTILVFAVQVILDIPLGITAYQPVHFQMTAPGGVFTDWLSHDLVLFLRGRIWTPITYMFLHGGLLHLFLNVLWLFIFGPDVERALGTRRFYLFYLICGAIGIMATFVTPISVGIVRHGWGPAPTTLGVSILRELSQSPPILGASGAVMGVMIAFVLLEPGREFILFPLPLRVTARGLLFIIILVNLGLAFGGANVSVSTHFGGMITGFLYLRLSPLFRKWYDSIRGVRRDKDPLADAVDQILRFDKRKRH